VLRTFKFVSDVRFLQIFRVLRTFDNTPKKMWVIDRV
jgi:hypothetical protein